MIYASQSPHAHRYADLDEVVAQATAWFEAGEIGMVVGYGRQSPHSDLTMPMFVTRPDMLADELVWNSFCEYNLLNYTNLAPREAARGKGGIAIMVKPCELHNLDILTQEGSMSGVTADNVRPMAMACTGIYETEGLNAYTREDAELRVQTKCLDCPEYEAAHGAEEVARQQAARPDYATYRVRRTGAEEIDWGTTLDKCLHCYSCRNVCPSCYCTNGCPVDEAVTGHVSDALRRTRGIEASRQMIYNVVRTWHIQSRCSECQECERVCPVGIPIMALKGKLEREFSGTGSPGDTIGFLTEFTSRILSSNLGKDATEKPPETGDDG